MLMITNYTVDVLKDPFGILAGKRYEFKLDLDIPEDDELHSEHGIYARIILKVDEDQTSVVSNDLLERTTDRLLDFDMEAEEEEAAILFCKEHIPA
ncbi:DUF6509 family protein [Paenibacillus wynnii]|uniref:Pullulanase n=1 Tax=Paenibacillus wynnii TaxID=268407 RepID=A0A098MF79_9BACL|nr:DUF6509 family protein [Paenibacillus wynnii]KGE20197.1 pullulanase [Paenibacillus wynnii]